MSKRTHDGAERPLRCVESYEFSQCTYGNVVPRSELYGCRTMLTVLDEEIGIPLRHPTKFELTPTGTLPTCRCVRFFGVENSSKTTAVLSFAMDRKIDVLVIRTITGFRPAAQLAAIYEKLHRFDRPGIVLFSGVESMFFTDEANIVALRDCLRRVQESQYLLWTVMTTSSMDALPYQIDKYFSEKTQWSGILIEDPEKRRPPEPELFTALDRVKMMTSCISRFCRQPELFPWPKDRELVEFVEKHTSYCTFTQIHQFVRKVFNLKRRESNQALLLGLAVPDENLVPSKEYFYQCLRPGPGDSPTISLYDPQQQNVNFYLR